MKQITLLITGGIGSGKSTVARYLTKTYGIPVFYSDEEAKKLYEDPEILAKVNEIVGGGIISGDGKLDKRAFAKRAFCRFEILVNFNRSTTLRASNLNKFHINSLF